MKYKLSLFLLIILFCIDNAFAQSANIEMADEMMKNGKINVVITVLCIVFLCIAFYLVLLDRRITKREKELQK